MSYVELQRSFLSLQADFSSFAVELRKISPNLASGILDQEKNGGFSFDEIRSFLSSESAAKILESAKISKKFKNLSEAIQDNLTPSVDAIINEQVICFTVKLHSFSSSVILMTSIFRVAYP